MFGVWRERSCYHRFRLDQAPDFTEKTDGHRHYTVSRERAHLKRDVEMYGT